MEFRNSPHTPEDDSTRRPFSRTTPRGIFGSTWRQRLSLRLIDLQNLRLAASGIVSGEGLDECGHSSHSESDPRIRRHSLRSRYSGPSRIELERAGCIDEREEKSGTRNRFRVVELSTVGCVIAPTVPLWFYLR
jgi:hypothetical protein